MYTPACCCSTRARSTLRVHSARLLFPFFTTTVSVYPTLSGWAIDEAATVYWPGLTLAGTVHELRREGAKNCRQFTTAHSLPSTRALRCHAQCSALGAAALRLALRLLGNGPDVLRDRVCKARGGEELMGKVGWWLSASRYGAVAALKCNDSLYRTTAHAKSHSLRQMPGICVLLAFALARAARPLSLRSIGFAQPLAHLLALPRFARSSSPRSIGLAYSQLLPDCPSPGTNSIFNPPLGAFSHVIVCVDPCAQVTLHL